MLTSDRPAHITIRGDRRRVVPGLVELWTYRELLYFFIWRDLKVRYKQSIIGVGWAVIQPFTLMVLFTYFFGHFAKLPAQGPRPVFYYSALLLWTYFNNAVSQAAQSVVNGAPMLTKVYFPRLLFPLSAVLSNLVDFAIAFMLLAGLMAYYVVQHAPNVHLGPQTLLIIPLTLVVVITALAVSLWLSAWYARYRDIRYLVTFLLQFWMFASPVMYPSTIIPAKLRAIYFLNPLAGAIEGMRWSLTGLSRPPATLMLISMLAVLVVLVGGLRHFRKFEGTVADVV